MTSVVSLYQHPNYKGWAVSLAPGEYPRAALEAKGFKNDQLSSLKIANAIVILYNRHGYGEPSRTITGPKDVPSLVGSPYSFDNVTTSIKVIAIPSDTATILYGGCGNPRDAFPPLYHTSWAVPLPLGSYTLSQLKAKGFVDNTLSALKIGNVIVTLYQDDNFQGNSLKFTGPGYINCLTDYRVTPTSSRNFNDRVSSVKIEPIPSNTSVILYKDKDYNLYSPTAWTVMLPPGDYKLADLTSKGVVDNALSSLKIMKPNTVVTLYSNDNFEGNLKSFYVSNNDLSKQNFYGTTKKINDKTTSIMVRELVNVSIYKHCKYDGWVVKLPLGEHKLAYLKSLGFVDNDASSIRIGDGFTVTLYRYDNFGGESVTFTGPKDVPCFKDYRLNPTTKNTFNDRVSSIKVTRTSTAPGAVPAPSGQPAPSPAPATSTPAPAPPINSYFRAESYIKSSSPADRADTNGCSVYYTNLIDACDSGVFELQDKEIQAQYGNNQNMYNMIMNEKKNLPEPGVCKIKLQNWKLTSNSPLLNAVEPGLGNRGDPSTWAYCFQPLQGNTTIQTIGASLQGSTNFDLHPTPFTGLFGDNLSYARLAFKKLDYASVKNDTCSNINRSYIDPTIPTELIGLRVDSSMIIKGMAVYTVQGGKLVEDKTLESQTRVYSRLFEEKLETTRKLMYNPKSASGTVFVMDKDVCANMTNKMTASAIFNIGDFGVVQKQLYMFANNDPYKGTTVTLEDQLKTVTTAYQDELKAATTQAMIDSINKKYAPIFKNIQDKLATIRLGITNTLKEQLPSKVIGKRLHSGIPTALISNDSTLYLQVL